MAPILVILLLLAMPVAGPAQTQDVADSLAELFERHFEDYLALDPIYATSIGDNRYNDRLTLAIDPRSRSEERALWKKARLEVAAIDPTSLENHDRLHLAAFHHTVEANLALFEYPEHLLPITPGFGLHASFAQMGSGKGMHPFLTSGDYDDFLSRMADFERWVDVVIANLREGMERGIVHPRRVIDAALPELRQHFSIPATKSVFYRPVQDFPDHFDEAERQRLSAAYLDAITEIVMPSYERLHTFLRKEYEARSTISMSDLPEGRDWYHQRVRFFTTTEIQADEIYELGLREVARIQGEMKDLRKKMKFRGNLPAFRRAMASDSRNYLSSQTEVLTAYAAIRSRVTSALPRMFVRLPSADFEIRQVEAHRSATMGGAFYERPKGDGSQSGVFYFNMRGRAYPEYTMETLFLHEALPGHHFQIALAQELELPRFLRFGYFGAYVEGWGLYCESLGTGLGLYTDAAQYYGRLTYELGRAGRLVADVGIHHKGWSRRKAERELGERGLYWAVGEIDRYTVMPGQALAYKIGELEILDLRRRAQEQLSESFDLRRFHDVVLRDGPLPLGVLESKVERWISEGGQ